MTGSAFNLVEIKPTMSESKNFTIPAVRITETFHDQFEAAHLQASIDAGFCSDKAEFHRRCLYFSIKYMKHEESLKKIKFGCDGNVTIKL